MTDLWIVNMIRILVLCVFSSIALIGCVSYPYTYFRPESEAGRLWPSRMCYNTSLDRLYVDGEWGYVVSGIEKRVYEESIDYTTNLPGDYQSRENYLVLDSTIRVNTGHEMLLTHPEVAISVNGMDAKGYAFHAFYNRYPPPNSPDPTRVDWNYADMHADDQFAYRLTSGFYYVEVWLDADDAESINVKLFEAIVDGKDMQYSPILFTKKVGLRVVNVIGC